MNEYEREKFDEIVNETRQAGLDELNKNHTSQNLNGGKGETGRQISYDSGSQNQSRPALRFQELTPTKEQIEYTKRMINPEALYTRSTRDTNEQEKFYGFLGETIVCDLFNQTRPQGVYDGGSDFTFNGADFDVKVRMCNAPPKEDYFVKVYKNQLLKGINDLYYLFLLYYPAKNVFYVAGVMSKKGFLNTAKLYKEGDMVGDMYRINNHTEEQFVTEIYNLAVARLPIKKNIGGL